MKLTGVICFFMVLFGLGCRSEGMVSHANGSRMLLEVYSESPTNYPPDKYLLLRVYEDRRIEYDTYPAKPQFPVPFARIAGTLERSTFEQVRNLLEEFARTNDRKAYGPHQAMQVDSHIVLSMRYVIGNENREVKISENDSHIHFDQLENSSLRELLKLSYKIRDASP